MPGFPVQPLRFSSPQPPWALDFPSSSSSSPTLASRDLLSSSSWRHHTVCLFEFLRNDRCVLASGSLATQLSMALSTTQLRWSRLLLVFLGAFAIAFRFWPAPRTHYSVAHSGQAWDDLVAIANQTLGVSACFGTYNGFLVSQICSSGKFLPSICAADPISAITLSWARRSVISSWIGSMVCFRTK